MFNISKLVNRITERGREGSGDPSAAFVESEDQHSAEGFLCPPCMRAFPSAEALEDHYNATHLNTEAPADSPTNGDIQVLRQEIQNLQSSLNEEKTTSAELKNEVLKMQAGFQSRDEDNLSVKSQEKEFENAKAMLTSEVALLRQQLVDSLEQVSTIKKEKEILGQRVLDLAAENDTMKSDVNSLHSQLAHKNSIDDAAVLKQELVSVQRMMDQLSLEKEKEIENLNAKMEQLELSLNSCKTAEGDQEKLNEAKSEVSRLEKLLQEDQEMIEGLKSRFADEKDNGIKELDILKDQLSDSERKRNIAEKEGADLKDLVKGLESKLEELYSKIEGGEGAKAALETLQKENGDLKDSLEAAQDNINEVSKNLYNTNKKLEKSEAEFRKLGEGYSAEKEEWKAKELLLKDQLKRQEEELKLAAQKYNDATKAVQEKNNELKVIQGVVDELKKKIRDYEVQTKDLITSKGDLEKQLTSELKKAKDLISSKDNNLKELQSLTEKLSSDVQNKSREIKEQQLQLQSSQEATSSLEEQNASLRAEKVKLSEQYSTEVKRLEAELKFKTEALDSKVQELEDVKRSSNDTMERLKVELEELRTDRDEKDGQLEGLQNKLQDLTSKYEEREGKLQLLQVQTDEILTEKIDLERRVKSSEEEKSLLLERCLSGEAEVEELRQTIKTIQRKLDDSHAALQELGRENQSLQMESAKLQGRKWADDSLVTNCSTCEKEFTLTIRKHHCRHCGQIFCNDCSSRNAAVPSCKKPARVCDACYQELMTK